MSSTGFFPEKHAAYFSSMSPLAGKIYSDIQSIDSSDKLSQHLTYKEKCYLVDKYLIHDLVPVINRNRSETSLDDRDVVEEISSVFNDGRKNSVLEEDHLSALLLSVYPKKLEKYTYDDNICWIDEHSGIYSSCTDSQIKSCKLAALVKAIPIPEHKQPCSNFHKKHKAPTKPVAPAEFHQSVEINFNTNYSKEDEDDDENYDYYETQNKNNIADENPVSQQLSKKIGSNLGVAVMGGEFGKSHNQQQGSLVVPQPQTVDKESHHDNLPQQKQNLDLIAELQAKLNKNKTESNRSGSKIHKPKAPPPPPPKVTGNEVKGKEAICADISSDTLKKIKTTKEMTNEDEFIVDISSPCRIATPKTGFDFLDNW